LPNFLRNCNCFRLTPLYLFVILLYSSLLPLIGTGIQWKEMEIQGQPCREMGWRNLLYINNFLPKSKLLLKLYIYLYTKLVQMKILQVQRLNAWRTVGTWQWTCNSTSSLQLSSTPYRGDEVSV